MSTQLNLAPKPRLQVKGIAFQNSNDIITHIKTLAPKDQYAFQKLAAAKLTSFHKAVEDELQYFKKYFQNSNAHTFASTLR